MKIRENSQIFMSFQICNTELENIASTPENSVRAEGCPGAVVLVIATLDPPLRRSGPPALFQLSALYQCVLGNFVNRIVC